ncbi:MAG: GDSL-type esterase/lipase family protein [Lachnospiraceae bacterium]|nr:GDSL-type esterase/lipase family protein [Lachnospiraceae bacterium]
MKKYRLLVLLGIFFLLSTGFSAAPTQNTTAYIQPNADSVQVGTINKDSVVEVIEVANSDWYRINSNGMSGYVESKKMTTKDVPADSGLLIDVIGDSITYGNGTTSQDATYGSILGKMFQARVKNYGINGTTLAGYASTPFVFRYNVMDTNANMIIVFGGTNDFYLNVPIGTMGDTTPGTFYGGLNVLMYGLKTKYPNAQLVFLTPLKRTFLLSWNQTNGVNATLQNYRDAILAMGNAYGIKVIDLFPAKELDFTNRPEYMPDGLHLSDMGHQVLAEYIYEHL